LTDFQIAVVTRQTKRGVAFVGEAGQIVGGTVVIVHHGLQIAVLFDFDPGLNLET
jgi:hypothetical protein